MTMIGQILWGSVLLVLCSLLHIFALVYVARFLRSHFAEVDHFKDLKRWVMIVSGTFLAVVLAHTVQVWSWAVAFHALGALPNMNSAIYFSMVTYTTVGYGDVTLGDDFRVFGAMASVTGLLTFGLSTAFLVGLFMRMLEKDGHRK